MNTGGDWREQAACRGMDPDVFFPARGKPRGEAMRVCAGCKVQKECLEYALDNGMTLGIWGGVSERARRQLRRGRPLPERECGCCGRRFAPGLGANRLVRYCSHLCQVKGYNARQARYRSAS